jgi:hypothetical protein
MPKRTSFRAQERLRVRLGAALRDPRLGWVREARVVDLHLFGAGLEMPDPPDVGTVLVVEVSAPSLWDPLRLPATVVWTKAPAGRGPARLGVRFDHAVPEPLLPLFDLLSDLPVYETPR